MVSSRSGSHPYRKTEKNVERQQQQEWMSRAPFALCDVCMAHGRAQDFVLVPDRYQLDAPYRCDQMCLVCLDDFLGAYPHLFSQLQARELYGRIMDGARVRTPQRHGSEDAERRLAAELAADRPNGRVA